MAKLKVVSVAVHDMTAAREFYASVLGFEIDDDSMAPHFIELKSEGPTLLLALCEKPQVSEYPAGATIALNVDVADAAAELDRLRAAGVSLIHDELQESPVGPYFAVRDPSGNIIELVQFSN